MSYIDKLMEMVENICYPDLDPAWLSKILSVLKDILVILHELQEEG